MKHRLTTLLAFVSMLGLTSCHGASAEGVTLSQTTEYFGNKQGALKAVRIYDTVVGKGNHQYSGFFEAKNYGEWTLSLFTYAIDMHPASIDPLDVPEEDILGRKGLLFQCLDRFLADVPNASVNCVKIELRSCPKLWEAFLDQARLTFRDKTGVYNDGKAVDQEMGLILRNLLQHSEEARVLGDRIAARLGRSLSNISTEGEIWEFHSRIKIGVKLSEISKDPHAGYTMSPVINFYFKSQAKPDLHDQMKDPASGLSPCEGGWILHQNATRISYSFDREKRLLSLDDALKELSDSGRIQSLNHIFAHALVDDDTFQKELFEGLQRNAPRQLTEALESSGNMHNPKMIALAKPFAEVVMTTPTVIGFNNKLVPYGLKIEKGSFEKLELRKSSSVYGRRFSCGLVFDVTTLTAH